MNDPQRFLPLAAPALLALGLAALPAAAERERTLAVLDALAAEGRPGLSLQVGAGGGAPIAIGDPVEYRLRSDRDAHVTLLHVDANGVLTVMQPSAALPDTRVESGALKRLPGADSGIEFTAEPPLGVEAVYAIATARPLQAPGLGDAASGLTILDVDRAPGFVEGVARALRASGADFSVARVEQRIVGRSGTQYTVADITRYFTTRTRSISRPRLDLKIHFDSGSAELGDEARRELEVFGTALQTPGLVERRFVLSGHTDDRGTEEYNLDLSRRRAEAARRYLEEQAGIDPRRVSVEGYGEMKPKEPNISEETRAENRRVEFTLLP